MPKAREQDIGYLFFILAIFALAICGGLAIWINVLLPSPTGSVQDAFLVVTRQLLYSFSGAAALFAILYVSLSRKRLMPAQIREDVKKEVLDEQFAYLIEVADRFPSAINPEFRQIHYGSFNSLPVWKEELEHVQRSIDIVVYYFDSWVREQASVLREAAQRGVKVRLFLPDPNNSANVDAARAVFPSLDETQIKEKITNTARRFESVGFKGHNLSINFLPHALSYSVQCFDGKKLFISLFEYGRQLEIASPVFEIDLRRPGPMPAFWNKELTALIDSIKS